MRKVNSNNMEFEVLNDLLLFFDNCKIRISIAGRNVKFRSNRTRLPLASALIQFIPVHYDQA